VNGWLSSFQFVFHQKNLIKRVLNLVLYKIEFLILKFKSYLLKPKFKILNEMIFFLNININHLAQNSLINMTLKWHYINMCDKIDSFLVVQHGF
jgi:hypothetical protein